MLKELRQRFIVIMMGLVGAVLLVMLTVSVVSSYRTEVTSIEDALSAEVTREPSDPGHPWIGGRPGAQMGTSGLGDRGDPLTLGNRTGEMFTPVYLVTIDRSSGSVLARSEFVNMDETLLAQTFERIEALGPLADGTTRHGRFGDLKLFYHIEITGTANNGTVIIALADASPLNERTMRSVITALAIWLGAMVALFFVSLLLSRIALRPVAQAWENQRRFVADASHELKTPLTVILANSSLLAAHPEKTVAEQTQWLESTQVEAQRMDGLVHDLLLLAQTDDEEPALAYGGASGAADERAVDLSALVNRNVLQFEAVFFERAITLVSTVAPGVQIRGNEPQLDRLLQILLDNASKYADKPDAPDADADATAPLVTVTLAKAASGKQQTVLCVHSTGKPIAPEALPRLFDRFYRGDSSHNDTEGYGLGLSLAKNIVAAHGGSIEVTSALEQGTTFTVRL
ncbi:MAG: HAMP domain-containing histidine kinase [Coriobacteriales bacterium]|jgi:signal transduction histidine kinase|nr:HAMP domain-containing histidine kinase [Coriobacteriales bacterium]